MKHTTISLRLPMELLNQLEAAAEKEAKKTGLSINRSDIARRAIANDPLVRLQRKEPAPEAKK